MTTELSRSELRERTVQLSLSHGLFLLILVVGATLRFGYLGELPLGVNEARQALQAWQLWQPPDSAAVLTAGSPAYVTLSAIIFAFFGASDAAARLAPAVFGLITVALPWLWRSRLGEAGALALSGLLAVSPTINLLSATAGGDAMAIATGFVLFIAWMHFRDDGRGAWLVLAAAALGFGLATSAHFYSMLLTLAAAWLVQRVLGVPAAHDSGSDGTGMSMNLGRRAIFVLAATFVVVATFFLWRPIGLGSAMEQLGNWLMRFGLQGGLPGLALPFLALVRYELIVVTLGAAAIVWASWRGYSLPLFMVYWFAVSLVLTLLQWNVVSNAALLVLPSYILIALWLQHALHKPATQARWALALTLLALGAVAYFNGARYLRVMSTAPQQLSFLFLAFVAVVAGAVAVNFTRSWDRSAAHQGALIGLLLLFTIFSWGTTRWMLSQGGNDPREYWVDAATDDDLRMLAQLVREVSWQTTGSAHDVDVLVGVDAPSLRWYLREFPNAVFGQTVPPGADQQVIITEAVEDALAPGEDYLGADFGLVRGDASMPIGAPLTITDTLRWWIFHEHPTALASQQIILWVRNDILSN